MSTDWVGWNLGQPSTAKQEMSTARIAGRRYITIAYVGIFTFNADTQQLVPANILGINGQNIKYMTSAAGYGILVDNDTVYWDNPATRSSDQLDYVPSIGGAGSSKVNDLRGSIVGLLPLANGFIIYSTTNAVSAQFSGDPNFPFVFAEIPGSSGIASQYSVATGDNRKTHIAYTRAGAQEISFTSAINSFPAVSDFLKKNMLEEFDFVQGFTRTKASSAFQVKLQLIAQRFVLLSYAEQDQLYRHTLVYDIDLKRWGRIDTAHVAMFEMTVDQRKRYVTYQQEFEGDNRTYNQLADIGMTYNDYFIATTIDALLNTNIGFIKPDGEVDLVLLTNMQYEVEAANLGVGGIIDPDTDYGPQTGDTKLVDPDFNSQIIIGRIGLIKNRPTQILEVEAQNIVNQLVETGDGNVRTMAIFFCHDFDIFDPQNLAKLDGIYFRGRSAAVQRMTKRATARSFLVAMGNKFSLTNVMIQFQQNGKR